MSDRVRRGAVAAVMLALFALALTVFVLPFAFPTPPPIVTRFNATVVFSPNDSGRRDVAKVNVRLSEPSDVTLEIQSDGRSVRRLMDAERRPTGWIHLDWDGRDDAGRALPDGSYALKLRAVAGRKRFDTTRSITIDTAPPRVASLEVASATLAGPGRGECRLTFRARDAGSLLLEARRPGADAPLRRVGERPVREGEEVRWRWDGRREDGARVAPGHYTVHAVLFDTARNRVERARSCWVGYMSGAAVPAGARPRDAVGVRLVRGDGRPVPPATPLVLTVHRRTGMPGRTLGHPLGPQIGGGASGPAGRVRVALPAGIRPDALWVLARTRDGSAAALVRPGGGR